MFRTIQTGGWLSGIVCVFLSTAATAELPPAEWLESIHLWYSATMDDWAGTDPSLPEPHTEELDGTGYDVKGILSYGPPGPPQVTVHQEGYGVPMSGTTTATVNFQFQLVEMSPPPITVTYVPVTVTVSGSTEASGGCTGNELCSRASASVAFSLTRSGDTFMDEGVGSDGAGQQELSFTKGIPMTPNRILSGSMRSTAHVSKSFVYAPSGWVKATASLSATITMSPGLIPGTDFTYSDFYRIEYSPGYWALGEPTPVAPTTWGRLKAFYSHD